MNWEKLWLNIQSTINNKPVAVAVLLGIGFVVGYYVKLLACS